MAADHDFLWALDDLEVSALLRVRVRRDAQELCQARRLQGARQTVAFQSGVSGEVASLDAGLSEKLVPQRAEPDEVEPRLGQPPEQE